MINEILSRIKEFLREIAPRTKKLYKYIVLCGIILMLLMTCSCSSSRSTTTEKMVCDSETIVHKARDSISSELDMQIQNSGYLDVSDISILFYPPSELHPDTVSDKPPEVFTPIRTYPMLVNIGKISAGCDSKSSLKETTDSVGKISDDHFRESTKKDSVTKIRDPTPCRWPVFLVLGFALVMMIFTGWKLYRTGNS